MTNTDVDQIRFKEFPMNRTASHYVSSSEQDTPR
jgi:hypothetical protein